jgi:hypothetical protein
MGTENASIRVGGCTKDAINANGLIRPCAVKSVGKR